MSKRVTLTLAMLAMLAALGNVSFAIAPTISDIPDVIVGDAENVTTPNNFVYPDVFNLDSYVTDPDTTVNNLQWSYTVADPAHPRYQINGVPPLAVAENPLTPGDKRVDVVSGPYVGQEINPDGNDSTITIRDTMWSPLPVPGGGYGEPGGDMVSETVTLFASDGTNVDNESFVVYSDNGGIDRLVGQPVPTQRLQTADFSAGAQGFTGVYDFGYNAGMGAVTFSQGASGVCMEVGATGNASGVWYSASGFVPLVDNNVYRIRMSVTCDQTTPYQVPLWDLFIDNFYSSVGGPNAYGGDYFFLDNMGGANAAGSIGRTDFQVWFAPPALMTPSWRTQPDGPFAPANDATNDMRVVFRVFDLDALGINAQIDQGKLCMSNMAVDRFDYSTIVQDAVAYNAASLTRNTVSNPTGWSATSLYNTIPGYAGTTTISWGAGYVNVAPGNAGLGWDDELVEITPGDTVNQWWVPTTVPDNYPIAWEADALYQVQANFAMATLAGETNPPKRFRIGMDDPQSELSGMCFTSSQWNYAGSPKNVQTTFTSFFYSHSVTRNATAAMKALRPRLEMVTVDDELPYNGRTNATGAFRVYSCSVRKVHFPADVLP